MKHVTLIVSMLFLCLCMATSQVKHEIRAVWLSTNYGLDWPQQVGGYAVDAEQQKRDLIALLDKLRAANINVVFLQTRIRGDVIYQSSYEPWSKYVLPKNQSTPGYDPLEFAVNACHERGIECHSWFVTYPMGTVAKGQRHMSERAKSLVRICQEEYTLDPGEPETAEYLLGMVKELIQKYDIDGIHFDYIRYPEQLSSFPDASTYSRYGKGKSLTQWRKDNINQFVYQAYDCVKEIKPWVQVSSSVIGMYAKIPGKTQAYMTASEVCQDPADWLAKGKHDFIVPMMFHAGELFYPFVQDWLARSNNRWVIPGLGAYKMDEENWRPQTISDQVTYSRKNRTAGNAYFRTKYVLDSKNNLLNRIKDGFYGAPALLPPLTWMKATPPTAPKITSAMGGKQDLTIAWNDLQKSTRGKDMVYYNVYCSTQYPVDINNPDNLIACRLKGNQVKLYAQTAKPASFYYVVTAYDRFHNESIPSQTVLVSTGVGDMADVSDMADR